MVVTVFWVTQTLVCKYPKQSPKEKETPGFSCPSSLFFSYTSKKKKLTVNHRLKVLVWHFFPGSHLFYSAVIKYIIHSSLSCSTWDLFGCIICLEWHMIGVHVWSSQVSIFIIVLTWHRNPSTLVFFHSATNKLNSLMWKSSSLTHTHRFMGFFHNRNLVLVVNSSRPIE